MAGASDLNGSQNQYSMEHIHHESNYFILLQHKSVCLGGQWPLQPLHCCAERSCMSNRSCCCTPWRRTCGVNLPCFMRVNHVMEQHSKALVKAAAVSLMLLYIQRVVQHGGRRQGNLHVHTRQGQEHAYALCVDRVKSRQSRPLDS